MIKKHQDIIVPKYQLADIESERGLPPVKRTVFKTMEITETFTVYSVFQHLARMEKAIQDKQAEIDGLESMKKAYMYEVAIIEKQLGISDMEDEFARLKVEEVAAQSGEAETKVEEVNN